MSTKPPVKRNPNGTFAKGTCSPNPNGRPKKAAMNQFSSIAEMLAEFAITPITLMKNGKKVRQSKSEWVVERYFQQVMAGEVSAERFLRMFSEANSAVQGRHEEFLQDAIAYKALRTKKKRGLPPGTPWDPDDGPDPDLILIEDGQVTSLDPVFGDQHKRLEREIDNRKWRNRLRESEAAVTKFRRRLSGELDPDERFQLQEDLELAVYCRDVALYALGRRPDRPPRPKTRHDHLRGAPTVDDPSGDLPAGREGGDHGESS